MTFFYFTLIFLRSLPKDVVIVNITPLIKNILSPSFFSDDDGYQVASFQLLRHHLDELKSCLKQLNNDYICHYKNIVSVILFCS